MNKLQTRAAGASVLLAVLLGSTACGTETVNDTGPLSQPAPAKSEGAPKGYSADALERKAAADKKRQDQASIDRWDRTSQFDHQGRPGRP